LSEASGASWLEAVKQVLAAVRSSDVRELELVNGEFAIRLRRIPGAAHAPTVADEPTSHWHQVLAPFTGVFYRSPTPSARVYVSEGDWVDADSVIGLVETMKIFNEVTADISGRVLSFVAETGALVHAGDPLVLIEPGERATADSEPRP
jgi:acetyl-CoA carboxylase biotin carboxyl carrier protein